TATAAVISPPPTGVDELVVVPSPSCPSTFRPQHCTVPSERSTQVCRYPPLTALTLASPATSTGVVETPPTIPLPSWPSRSEERRVGKECSVAVARVGQKKRTEDN